MNEVKLKREWDNFRERDASVFKFNFSVSEKYFSKNTDGMIIVQLFIERLKETELKQENILLN